MRINTVTENLYLRYPGQSTAQDVFLEVNPGEDTISVKINAETGSAVPAYVWHGIVLRYPLNVIPSVEAANTLLAEVAALAARIIAGHDTKWNGRNYQGFLNADASAASEEMESITTHMDDSDQQPVWDMDFLARDLAGDLEKITADTTDQEIADLAAEIEKNAEDEGAVVDLDLRRKFSGWRQQLQENF